MDGAITIGHMFIFARIAAPLSVVILVHLFRLVAWLIALRDCFEQEHIKNLINFGGTVLCQGRKLTTGLHCNLA